MNETGVGIKDPLFFIGVVENNTDPRLEGRVQVRAFSIHGTVQQVPTEDLPWATLIYGSYDPNSAIPPLNSWVFGFFIDGRDAQQPMILGLIPTQMTEEIDPDRTGWGVIDPRNHALLAQYGRSTDYGQPSMSRLARGENIEETCHLTVETLRKRGIESAKGAPSWEEPSTAYNAQYPFNRVIETAGGHSVELDDTPGAERIMIYHKSGSYIQVDTRGTTTHRSQSDRYDVTSYNSHVYIGGRSLVTIEGDSYVRVNGNKTEEIIGDYTQIVRGNHVLSVAKQLNLNAGNDIQARGSKIRIEANVEDLNIKSAKDINIEASNSIHEKAGIALFFQAKNSANFKAGDNIFIEAGQSMHGSSNAMFLSSANDLNVKGTHVKIGGSSQVSMSGGLVSIDASGMIRLAEDISVAPSTSSGATEAGSAESTVMPEPPEASVVTTSHLNLTSIGTSGYASVDDDVFGTGGGAFTATGELDPSVTEGAIKPLLDLIGRAEGAGYDTVSNKSRILPDRPITSMTVSQLLDWQDRSVAAGSDSSAAGKYQVIRNTLRGIVVSSVINLSDTYSPQTQDKIAIYLAQVRGLNRFITGDLSAEAFGNNLAREWASFPVITGPGAGKSFYDGDRARNKSRIPASDVLDVLRNLKEAIDSGSAPLIG